MIFKNREALAAYEDREMAAAAAFAQALYVLLAKAYAVPERRAELSDLAGSLVEQVAMACDQAGASLRFLAPEAIALRLDPVDVAKRAHVLGLDAARELAASFNDDAGSLAQYQEDVRRIAARLAEERVTALRPTPRKPKPRRRATRGLPAHLRIVK